MGIRLRVYGASLAIWDHTVLPATRHKWTRPALTPAREAGTRFTYPGGMEGWVDLGSLIAARPGIETMTAWSQVRRPSRDATKPPVGLGHSRWRELTPNTATRRKGKFLANRSMLLSASSGIWSWWKLGDKQALNATPFMAPFTTWSRSFGWCLAGGWAINVDGPVTL